MTPFKASYYRHYKYLIGWFETSNISFVVPTFFVILQIGFGLVKIGYGQLREDRSIILTIGFTLRSLELVIEFLFEYHP